MKITRFLLAVCLGIWLSFARPGHAAPPIVIGYYPSYRDSLTPQNIRFDRFTHLVHTFVTADADGKMKTDGTLPSSALTAAAHAKGVQVLLGMGGGSGGKNFGAMARNPEQRAQFITDIVKLMGDNGYDGLVVDWEYPLAGDKDGLTEFVAQLKTQMRAVKADAILGLNVNAKPNNSKGFDGPKLKDNVDLLMVMTYDFHGPWSHAGYNTPLYEVAGDTVDGKVLSFGAALSYWRDVQGFAPDQIIFGLAGYGRGFKVAQWGEKPAAASQYPTIAFKQARALIGNGWTRQWDAEAHVPWLLSDDKTDRISYDDEESVADKAQWMKSQGLPGFFIWEIWQDYVDGDNLLVAAAEKAWEAPPVAK